MKYIRSAGVSLSALLFVAFLAGCGGSGGSDGSGDSGTGQLSLAVTDSPVTDASKVVVEFTGVKIQSSSATRIRFDFVSPRQIDLLALNGGGSELILDKITLPSGHYEWIRLLVNAECGTNDSYIEKTGDPDPHSLWIPTGSQNGLKLVSGFSVPDGGETSFTIDFDLRKSVNFPEGQGNCSGDYRLKPALRMVQNSTAGIIKGTIDLNDIIDPSCTTGENDLAVYAFQGADVIPDDIDGTPPEPAATANALDDNGDGIYSYELAFLASGNYTIAFTCKAQDDLAGRDDSVVFPESANAAVQPGEITFYDF